jgi:hypothetical protein
LKYAASINPKIVYVGSFPFQRISLINVHVPVAICDILASISAAFLKIGFDAVVKYLDVQSLSV